MFSSPDMKAPRLTMWKKIAFGIGAMPYAMCNTVVGFYLSIFLLEVAIVSDREDLISNASFNFTPPSLPPSLPPCS